MPGGGGRAAGVAGIYTCGRRRGTRGAKGDADVVPLACTAAYKRGAGSTMGGVISWHHSSLRPSSSALPGRTRHAWLGRRSRCAAAATAGRPGPPPSFCRLGPRPSHVPPLRCTRDASVARRRRRGPLQAGRGSQASGGAVGLGSDVSDSVHCDCVAQRARLASLPGNVCQSSSLPSRRRDKMPEVRMRHPPSWAAPGHSRSPLSLSPPPRRRVRRPPC